MHNAYVSYILPIMLPSDPLSQHFRLSAAHLLALKKLGISIVEDLLRHLPTRYDIGGDQRTIAGLTPGAPATVFGTIGKLETRRSWKRKIPVGEGVIRDSSGSIKIMWFHQPYLAKKFSEGMFVKAVGVVGGSGSKLYLANPHVEAADVADSGIFAGDPASIKKIFAVYPESRGLTSLWVRHALEKVFAQKSHELLEEPIPPHVLQRYHLPDLQSALVWVHTPEDLKHAEAARKRFAFEEIFALQVARAKERAENDAQSSLPIKDPASFVDQFLTRIPFPPTNAQRRAISDILGDFEKKHPMARLLEGDVGSGKTLVAAAAAYAVIRSRPPERLSGTLQVAYMAPTEILAQQHFQSFVGHFKDLPINIGLITGSGCKKFPSKLSRDGATDISRTQLLKWVRNGEIALLVGTHALIQKSVEFQHLALCIVDEQHRFGTRQRRALAHKGDAAPHFLSMTATPIPRTLALTMYGDLDLSILDELPPGRAKITTTLIKPKERQVAYDAIRSQLKAGRQAYVICPRIDEPDPKNMNALQAKSAKAEAKRLKKDVFPEFSIGLLHGAMKPKEKDEAMEEFASGAIQILVATSVVEVGINVPNATVILIEGAERFGLSQLHQLRGRVQRSSHPPFCFLFSESTAEVAVQRLKALAHSDDGFKLAEADLEARGAGDLLGRKQWGMTDLGMEALKNVKLIRAAREEAAAIIQDDPSLARHVALRERARLLGSELHAE